MAVTIDGTNGINDIVLGSSTPAAATVTTFTSNGIDDNADALAITIDSSENVGIGTASPTTYANGLPPVLAVGTSNNFATIQGRTDGPTGATNGASFGVSYSTNPINGARIWMGSQGSAGQQGLLAFETKALEDNTSQPLERMRIEAGGRVGIGTASPATLLEIASPASTATVLRLASNKTGSGSGDRCRWDNFSANNSGVAYQLGFIDFDRSDATATASYMAIQTRVAGTVAERMRIDSAGKVGIGTASPVQKLELNENTTSGGPYLQFENRGTGTTDNTNTYNVGGMIAAGYRDSSNPSNIASITFQRAPSASGASSAGSIVFGAMANGTTGIPTEHMRINSTGDFMVGITSNNPIASRTNSMAVVSGGVRSRSGTNNSSFGLDVTSGVNINFYTDNGSAFVVGGNIATNGGTTAYNTTSDYRSKNNIQPLTDALSRVALLRPVKWTWKEELGGTQPNGEGFIAHELAEILPMAVTGEKDELDEDGKPKYQGVDTRFLVATLTAAMQEQQATIEALTARITTLEG